ncbi:MAG: hypothetical protein OSA22_03640, partial [Aquiluna sp.]|nr:hypothetical protein [Aquiluna sp.]
MQKVIGLVCCFYICRGLSTLQVIDSSNTKTAPRLFRDRGCRPPTAQEASISTVLSAEDYCFSSRAASEGVKRCPAKAP